MGKHLDKIEEYSKFDNLTRLMLGIQKVSSLTQFHPIICTKLINLSRKALIKEKSQQNIQSLLNMLYVANNLKLKYSRMVPEKQTTEKTKVSIENFITEV